MSVVTSFWGNLESNQKIGLGLGSIAIIAISMLLLIWALKPNYGILFSDLAADDAASIVEKLEELGVAYQLVDGGNTILVPDERVHETRLKLTSAGTLMKGGVGFELFDQAEYGMTDFAQKINYQRALQGELSRTITSLAKVKHARVHLVLPESSLFRKKEMQASAAVTLVLDDGSRLTDDEVVGIQRLVAASVQDLSSENIVVADQRGAILSNTLSDESALVENRLREKQQIEMYLKEKIVGITNQIFGNERGMVTVDIALNYDQVQRLTETPLPAVDDAGNILVRRSVSSRSVKPTSTADTAQGKVASSKAVTENDEKEFVFGKSVEERVYGTGDISRMTISVLLPNETLPEDIVKIRQLVIAATGFDVNRGDVLEVNAVISSVQAGGQKDGVQDQSIAVEVATNPQGKYPVASADSSVIKIGDWSIKILYLVYLLVAIIGIQILIILFGGSKSTRKLNDEEREALLKDIKTWLKVEA